MPNRIAAARLPPHGACRRPAVHWRFPREVSVKHATRQTSLPLALLPGRRLPARLLPHAHARTVAAGAVVLVQGVAAPFVYLVESGVLVSELCTLDGSRATVSLLRAGDVFGEAALAGAGSKLPSTVGGPGVRALTASRLLALDPGEVDRALDADPAARRWFTNGLLDRLARTERRLGRTLALPLAGRGVVVVEELGGGRGLAGGGVTQE